MASDVHAAEGVWRKLLNAVRLGIWKVDAVLVAGDLSGKSLVPLVQGADGAWRGELGGEKLVARDEESLAVLERSVADKGLYAVTMSEDEYAELRDQRALERRFVDVIKQRTAAWMTLARERLSESGTPLYLIPGNDDPFDIDPLLEETPGVINADGRIVRLPDGRELIGFASSNRTPWLTARELEEDDIEQQLRGLLERAQNPEAAVLMTHVPPHDSTIDTVPKLDEQMRPVMSGGQVVQIPCGSVGVRNVIEEFQPVLTVHGHVHESPGHVRLGRSLCVNAGSEAGIGILRACLIDVDDGGARAQRVEG